jgi:lipoate-protein ligase A
MVEEKREEVLSSPKDNRKGKEWQIINLLKSEFVKQLRKLKETDITEQELRISQKLSEKRLRVAI